MSTDINWIMLYSAMYLNTLKEVTRAHRPSFIKFITHSTFCIFEVKGAATEASASDRDIPTWAALRA